MSNFFKRSIFLGGLTAIVIAVFIGGVYLGYNERPPSRKIVNILNKEPYNTSPIINFEPFWKTWNIIKSEYVAKENVNSQEMVWGAIKGLVASLNDPYSVFFPPKEAKIFESSVRGDFEGVGMEIGIKNKILTVIAPLKGTPAEKAGIKSGDKIIKINSILTSNLTIDEAVNLIRGKKGTKVTLTILREGQNKPIEITITRDVIKIPVLETEKKANGIFVIRLYNFSARSPDAFRQALREMVKSRSSKLILDLRGNAGGYLEAAVDITSWFLPLGKIVAREKFSNGQEHIYRSKGYNLFSNLPMVILVDQGTASAAEITAGALQEHKKAILIGEKTYGKGSVQELFPIGQGGSLKLTIARWLTPKGRCISKEGLKPDIEIKLTPDDKTDKQMEKAIEVLSQKFKQ